MKIFRFIFLALSAVMAVGCSKHVAAEKHSSEEAWIYDESLPVPIQFGVSGLSVKVRSPFNNLDDIEGEDFGIIAMDVEKGDVLLRGETATCYYDDVKERQMLQFEDEKYYPYTSECNFSFFAYYKGNNANAPVFGDDYVRLPITGAQWGLHDVLWARSDATRLYVMYDSKTNMYMPVNPDKDETPEAYYDGFNAAYIRYLAKDKPRASMHSYDKFLPTLSFGHASTNIRFKAVLESGTHTTFDSTPIIRSLSISGDDIYEGADLIVVNKNGGAEGYLDISQYDKGTITLSDLDCVPTEGGAMVGDGFFVQPLNKDSRLYLKLGIEHNGTIQYLDVYFDNPADLKAGHYYTFEFKLYTTPGVELAVSSVAPWIDGWTTNETLDLIGEDDAPTTLQ